MKRLIYIIRTKLQTMKRAINYISSVFSGKTIEDREESPPPVYETYDCQNFACVQDTNDLTTWKQLNIGKKQIYFCSEKCYYEYLKIPSTMGSYSPNIEKVRRDGHVKLPPDLILDSQTVTASVEEDKTSHERQNGSQKSSLMSPGTESIEAKK